MTEFAILLTGEADAPSVVNLHSSDGGLDLSGTGTFEHIPWWRLYRVNDSSSTHRFRRLDRRRWELRVTAGGDKDLLAHVRKRPIHQILGPVRWLEQIKLFVGFIVLLVTVAQHAPPTWLAAQVPGWAQARLTEELVGAAAPFRCDHAGGEAVLRKLLVRLDPKLGPEVSIIANRTGGFMVTAAPAKHIFMYHSSLNEVEPDALPALLAHELSHIRHGDAMVAVIRANGMLQTWGMIVEGGDRQSLRMDFSGAEERRADLEAMAMMRRAGIPLGPAAQMFEQMRISAAQGTYFGFGQREFHYGLASRSPQWAAAARSDGAGPRSFISEEEKEALFNFCWIGRIPEPPKRTPRVSTPHAPGSGVIGSNAGATRA